MTCVRAGRGVDEQDLHRLEVVGAGSGRPPRGSTRRATRPCSATSIPGSVRAVGSGARGSRCGRPRRGTGASIGPDLAPAAPSRQEGEALAVRGPARLAAAAGLADDEGLARAVGLDDPDLAVADIGQAPAVGRPLGVADRLLGGGQLGDRRATPAQRQRAQLAGAGELDGEGHDPVTRVDAELARAVDRDDGLDGQPAAAAGGTVPVGHEAGPVRTTHHGPSMARCLRVWPCRQS